MVNYIVSGCPRSGTSLTMRMLYCAGFPIAKDDKRAADNDNVHGYFEIDNIINKVKDNPSIVFDFDNEVLKITHFGIQYLPKGNYKIIYIERDIEEVLDSMEKMIEKKDKNREETRRVFLKYDKKVKKIMEERNDIQFIIINFNMLLKDPEPTIDKIITFYGIDSNKKEEMLGAIDKKSYRNIRV